LKVGIWFTGARHFVGSGFADVRKKQVVSKYHRVIAKEKKNLGDWNAKLKKIYAEAGSTADEDPLERFGRKKKKNGRNNEIIRSGEEASGEATVVSTVVHGDQLPSQSSEAKTSSNILSAAPDKSR